jgi:hypothetical protein
MNDHEAVHELHPGRANGRNHFHTSDQDQQEVPMKRSIPRLIADLFAATVPTAGREIQHV